jgi:anti-sigma B factor antagonist
MSTRTASPEAGLSREQFAEHTLIALSGELDIATAPSLRERLRVALMDARPRVVIDLAGVTFCDASWLALLVGARLRTGARDAVVLTAPRPQVARLLQVTGLDRVFTVQPGEGAAPAVPSLPASAAA